MRVIKEAWLGLVKHFAEEATRDPARRLERLEVPPMIEGAASNAKWLDAMAAYEGAQEQAQKVLRARSATSDAIWGAVARGMYSAHGLAGMISAAFILALLAGFGVLDGIAAAFWELPGLGWDRLWD